MDWSRLQQETDKHEQILKLLLWNVEVFEIMLLYMMCSYRFVFSVRATRLQLRTRPRSVTIIIHVLLLFFYHQISVLSIIMCKIAFIYWCHRVCLLSVIVKCFCDLWMLLSMCFLLNSLCLCQDFVTYSISIVYVLYSSQHWQVQFDIIRVLSPCKAHE